MDGSVSTLAPVFAAAFATHSTGDAFRVGLAASLGAGIMTALGGVGHTLPFLIPEFRVAMTAAMIVVLLELAIITWIRNHYMDTPPLSAAVQVGLGGALVFVTGVLIGNA